ncbi:propionate kinase/acetate kinase C [Erysipelotrichaceae bacterium]|nr:propionate kinase/acetate kinase C [Erysipelotrichaceae bacterium]
MKVLAVNAGSSSLKYQLFNMPEKTVICSGIAERIGLDMSIFSLKFNGEKYEIEVKIENHKQAIALVLEWFAKYKVVGNLDEINGVGHRVVHGGESFDKSVVIDEDVLKIIHDLSDFAPLHNPANIVGIEELSKALPHSIAVAVFDTAFHQTMPAESFMYATPYTWYTDYGIRKYGFHGTSHEYVSKQAAIMVDKAYNETKTIVCHLGNGASLCAIKNGASIDTTMGFTPLAGIPMGTRSGDIDPAIIPYIAAKENMDAQAVIDVLNKKSGFLGVSGFSSDARDISMAVAEGNERAILTLNLYAKRIAEVIGAYHVTLGGVDIIAFTAGIGENAGDVREAVCRRLTALGISIDEEKNLATRSKQTYISDSNSKIKVAVIPTNEELVIAEDTYAFLV